MALYAFATTYGRRLHTKRFSINSPTYIFLFSKTFYYEFHQKKRDSYTFIYNYRPSHSKYNHLKIMNLKYHKI